MVQYKMVWFSKEYDIKIQVIWIYICECLLGVKSIILLEDERWFDNKNENYIYQSVAITGEEYLHCRCSVDFFSNFPNFHTKNTKTMYRRGFAS